jgi:Heparinase II/III-like protein
MRTVEDPVSPDMSTEESLHAYAAAASVDFSPVDDGTFIASLPDVGEGPFRLLVIFDATDYPFERHCRFIRHRDPSLPYTFPNMDFRDSPPGLRVGPWPGWRGIPEMPGVRVRVGSNVTAGRFQFWGDEFSCRQVRAVFTLVLGNTSEDIRLSVDDPRIAPGRGELFATVDFRIVRKNGGAPVPVSGSAPCLLFTTHDLPQLQSRISTTHQHAWARVMALLEHWHLPPAKTPESKTVPGPERLFPEDRAIVAGLIALLDPGEENVVRATDAYRKFIATTQQDDYEPLRIDTQCGEILFLLCLGYDWLQRFLTPDERHDAQAWLFEVADVCWSHLGYERTDYAQAHFLGCGLGLLAFSFLFRPDHPRAEEWIGYCHQVLDRVLTMLPADGFFPHGINLWVYEYGFLLRWIELFRVCDNVDLWGSNPHWSNASRFRAAATSPDGLYGVTFGDPQYRIGGDTWCHYLIAARTGSGEARHLGDRLVDLPHEGVDYRHVPPRRRVYEFLYYPPNIHPRGPSGSLTYCDDGGQVFLHGEAGTDTLFTFRSGPPLGYQRYRMGERGAYGHGDPANGSFLIYRDSECVVSGPGPTYRRDTSLHNTITIDGRGQIGDSSVWLPDFFPPDMIPPSVRVRTDGERVLVRAEFGSAYLRDLGVVSCRRVLCADASSYIAGVDHITLDRERNIEWNLHTWGSFTGVGTSTVEIHAGGKIATLYLPDAHQVVQRTGLTEMVPAYPHDGRRDSYLRLTRNATRAEFIWCLMLRKDTQPGFSRLGESQWCMMFPDDRMIYWTGEWIVPDAFHEVDPVDTGR